MQNVVLKNIYSLDNSTLNNESEFQAINDIQKHIDKFNKESVKNERQSRMTDKNLLVCFVNKKRLLDIYQSMIYEYNQDNNVLKFSYRHYGMNKRFIVEITTSSLF